MVKLFDHAAGRNFKLFVSLDVWAAGNSPSRKKGPMDYIPLLNEFMDHEAWYRESPTNLPFVSTFSDGGLTNQAWIDFRNALPCPIYFVPDFDGTQGYYENNPDWWDYWGDVVDGLFSWESSWPSLDGDGSELPGSTALDAKVLQGTASRGKSYMIGISPLQYKNAVSLLHHLPVSCLFHSHRVVLNKYIPCR